MISWGALHPFLSLTNETKLNFKKWIIMGKSKSREVYRSAKTGKFVTKKYAQNHKATTVKETVKGNKI
jgi:hypothetical protein